VTLSYALVGSNAVYREEPPQSTGRNLLRAKKCSFVMGIFAWLEQGVKNC